MNVGTDASTRVRLIPVASDSYAPRSVGRRPRRFSVVLRTALVAVLLVLTGGIGATATAPASALPFDFCVFAEPPKTFEEDADAASAYSFYSWPGWASGLASAAVATSPVTAGASVAVDSRTPSPGELPLNEPYVTAGSGGAPLEVTGYEWWGTAGQLFVAYNYEDIGGQCGIDFIFTKQMLNGLANLIWIAVSALGSIGLTIFYYASMPDALYPFLGDGGPVDVLLTTGLEGIFAPFFIPIVMAAALWMAWVGLVKKRSSETIQGVAWMAFAATAALLFMSNPVAITNAVNNVTMTAQAVLMNTLTKAISPAGGAIDLCSLDPSRATAASTTGITNASDPRSYDTDGSTALRYTGIRSAQCAQWQTFILTPFMKGQFGDLSDTPVEYSGGDINVAISGRDMGSTANLMPFVWLDGRVLNHDETLQPDGLTDAQKEKKAHQRVAVYNTVETAYANSQASVATYLGNDPNQRIGVAFLAMVAMLAAFIPILLMTFMLLAYQLGTIFLIMLAPLFLTLGIHPGFGRKMALGWLEQIINFTLKRIGTTALISVLLVMLSALMVTNMPWIMQAFMISAVGIGMLMFRGRFLDMIGNVQLGGTTSLDMTKLGESGKRALGASYGAAGGVAGAAGQGVGVGGLLGAAVAGGMIGRRTGNGSPFQAARMGTRAGRGSARRNISKQRRQEVQESRSFKEQYDALSERTDPFGNKMATPEQLQRVSDLAEAKDMQGALSALADINKQITEQHRWRMQNDPSYRFKQEENELQEARDRAHQAQLKEAQQREQTAMNEDRAMASIVYSPETASQWVDYARSQTGGVLPRPADAQLAQALLNSGINFRPTVDEQKQMDILREQRDLLRQAAEAEASSTSNVPPPPASPPASSMPTPEGSDPAPTRPQRPFVPTTDMAEEAARAALNRALNMNRPQSGGNDSP